MPPRIGPKRPIRLFLAEWREAYDPPLSQEQLGQRIRPPVDKGTVSRWEKAARSGKLATPIVAAYAEALNRGDPTDLYRHPDMPPPLDSVAHQLGVSRDEALTAIEILASRKSRKAAS